VVRSWISLSSRIFTSPSRESDWTSTQQAHSETPHTRIEHGENIFLSARDVFEKAMLRLTNRKDGGRPFSLVTQPSPQTPTLHRPGTIHSAPIDRTGLSGSSHRLLDHLAPTLPPREHKRRFPPFPLQLKTLRSGLMVHDKPLVTGIGNPKWIEIGLSRISIHCSPPTSESMRRGDSSMVPLHPARCTRITESSLITSPLRTKRPPISGRTLRMPQLS